MASPLNRLSLFFNLSEHRKQETFQPSLSVVFDLQGQAAIQNLKRLPYHE
jgi:hypothetical protein